MTASTRGLVALVILGAVPRLASALPVAHQPAVGVLQAGATFVPVSLTGMGFGAGGAGSWLEVDNAGVSQVVQATDARIVVWGDQQIVVKLLPTQTEAAIEVHTPSGDSIQVAAEYYLLDSFDPASGGAIPAALAVDAQSRVWLLENFHTALKWWDPATQAITAVTIPHATGPGAFNTLGGQSWVSANGRDIQVDPLGRVWFAQTGADPTPTVTNHSRIVSYDPAAPAASAFKIWNVGGNQSPAWYLAWDATASRLWFTLGARKSCNGSGFAQACTTIYPARLVSFFPDGNAGFLPPSNTFDFNAAAASVSCIGAAQNAYPTAPTAGTCSNNGARQCFTSHDCVHAAQVCPAGGYDFWCYHEWPIPDATTLGAIAVDQDGKVWFANYGSGTVGRLDPSTGDLLTLPLRSFDVPPSGSFVTALGPRPISLDLATDASGNATGAVFGELGAGRISRVSISRLDISLLNLGPPLDPADYCLQLAGPNGSNGCVTELLAPNYCDVDASGKCVLATSPDQPILDKAVAGTAIDANGATWFSETGQTTTSATTSLGFLRAAFGHVVMLPPIALLTTTAFNGAGVAAPGRGVVWFVDGAAKRLRRLRALPVAYRPATAIVGPDASIPLSVTGTGFGVPGPGSDVVVQNAGGPVTTIPSTDAQIVAWSERQVVVRLGSSNTHATIQVRTPAGTTPAVAAEYYDLARFSTDAGANTSSVGNPNEIAVDFTQANPALRKVWITGEFGTNLDYWDPADQAVHVADADQAAPDTPDIEIPHGPGPGGYATPFHCSAQSFCKCPANDPNYICWGQNWKAAGEDVDVDTLGRLWVAHSGNGGDADHPNYSRIISYDQSKPASQRYNVWNAPGDNGQAQFVAWDAPRGALWFDESPRELCNLKPQALRANGFDTEKRCARAAESRLMKFFPDSGWLHPDNTFDFGTAALSLHCNGFSQNAWPDPPTPGTCANNAEVSCFLDRDCMLAEKICPKNTVYDFWCFHQYPIPGTTYPAQIFPDANGRVWYAGYVGAGMVGRLDPTSCVGQDPATCQVLVIPLRPTEPPPDPWVLGTSPWDMKLYPAPTGDLVFSEFGAARMARLNGSQVDNVACQSLVSLNPGADCVSAPDTTCINPCVTQIVIPNECTVDAQGDCASNNTAKGVAVHPDGTAWFSEVGPIESSTLTTLSLGYMRTGGTRIVLLPPIDFFKQDGPGVVRTHRGSGLDIDPISGQIWYTEMFRHEVGRLTKRP